jgi:predicted ATPase
VNDPSLENLEPPLPRSLGRYQVRRLLGRGGMGVVYEVLDPDDGSVVALKTLSQNEAETAERLYRLKQEFRAVADLQHPNLIRFGELSSHDGQWFFTMELVKGQGFVDYVQAAGDARTGRGVKRLREALAQLVSALTTIHEAGQVHRDVKPSNVLVTDDGRVVVLDFGLMAADGVLDNALSGTPEYMAPEQIEGRAAGSAADWYAVGAMLFAALTGRPPFVGSAMDVMEAKLIGEAPSPRELAPDVPPELDALCVALLQTQPELRPKGDEIRARLGLLDGSAAPWAGADSTQTFVGRDAELREFERALQEVRAGQARTIVVEGEPGMGKSALVQRFLASTADREVVLVGRSYEQESVPFKGLDAIVDALSDFLLALPDEETRALLAGGVRFLATVFPVLNRVPLIAQATSHARLVDKALVLREHAFGEFERLLGALLRTRTVIVFLDDVQWADKDSLTLLARALHQDRPLPFLFLTTMRSGAELPAGAGDLLKGAIRMSLAGLSSSESRRLCAEVLHDGEAQLSAESRQGDADSDALVREAGGHPLYLTELLRAAGRGDRRGERAAKLQDVLWERIQAREPIERRFLEMLALAGAPISYDVVARAAGVDPAECRTRLGALRAAQLVRISRRDDERLVLPYHDRIRETILLHRQDASAGGQDAVVVDQLRLGRALLEATPPDLRSTRIFTIVQHLNAGRDLIARGGERTELAELNLLAAREALRATAYDVARTYAAVGAALLGEAGWRDAYTTLRDLEVERMRAEFLAGDVARARERFEATCARTASVTDRTDLTIAWIELQSSRCDFVSAVASGRERLREIGISIPRQATPLSVLLQFIATRWTQARRTPGELAALPTLTEPQRASVMNLLMAMTPAAYWVSSDLVGYIALKLARMSMRYGVSAVSAYGFATYGVVLTAAFGKRAEAFDMGRLSIALNERFGNEGLAPSLYLIAGTFLVPWVRPFAEAKEHLSGAYDRAIKEGDTTYEVYAACALSHMSAFEAVDLPAHQKLSQWAHEVCTRRKDWNMAGSIVTHLWYLRVLRGEVAPDLGAGAVMDPDFVALVGDAGKAPSAHDGYWQHHASIAYHFGRYAMAAACLAETRRFGQAHFGHLTTIDLCFQQCLIAAKLHDSASWAKRARLRWTIARGVRKLRSWAEACPENFEPQYRIALAELTRVRGDDSATEAAFERAIASARARGAVLREGLSLELAMVWAAAAGNGARAEQLRVEAIDAYRRCGAMAKAEALSQRGAGTNDPDSESICEPGVTVPA